MLALLPERLGDLHDEVAARAQGYLLRQAARIARAGVPVVLDWGFWARRDRDAARAFFASEGLPCRLFYREVVPGAAAPQHRRAQRPRAQREGGRLLRGRGPAAQDRGAV